jgi:UPF0755 protein
MFNKYKDRYLLNRELYNRRAVLFFVFAVFILFYSVFISAPKYYPLGSIYNLKHGETLSSVSSDLANDRVIRSEFWFKSFVYLFSWGGGKILEGDYALNNRENVVITAWRVTHGSYYITTVKVTIPEGLNSYEISSILNKNLTSFNKEVFLGLVKKDNLEGYLFPDTYFFMPNAKEEEVIKTMNDNFNTNVKDILPDIKTFGKSTSDVIKMASILEEEARLYETRRIIAGILWK